MDLEKFTERARGFVQAAQTIAMREDHQKLAPEHLLKALMDDSEGMASNLIVAAGGAPAPAKCWPKPKSLPRTQVIVSCR